MFLGAFGRRLVFLALLGVVLGVILGVVMTRFFVPNANVAVVRRVSRCRDIVTISLWSDVATNFVMTRLSQWSNEFRDVAMERRIWRCRDGATNFGWSDGTMERQISRCRDGTMDFAISRWSDDFRDGAI